MNVGSTALACSMMALALGGCAKPRASNEEGGDGASTGGVDCEKLVGEMRALRDGPMRCESDADCTVWHNGEYYDGCPVEVTVKAAAELDELRASLAKSGCDVATDGACAPQIVHGCGNGVCGRDAALGQELPRPSQLTPEQMDALSRKIKTLMDESGIEPTEPVGTGAEAPR